MADSFSNRLLHFTALSYLFFALISAEAIYYRENADMTPTERVLSAVLSIGCMIYAGTVLTNSSPFWTTAAPAVAQHQPTLQPHCGSG